MILCPAMSEDLRMARASIADVALLEQDYLRL